MSIGSSGNAASDAVGWGSGRAWLAPGGIAGREPVDQADETSVLQSSAGRTGQVERVVLSSTLLSAAWKVVEI